MTPTLFKDALILSGPTGSGKTQLSLTLAERLDAEIVSMDSMAVYRGLDIAAAKPSPEARQRVPHHLIDVLDPWESASVSWWLQQAARCMAEIRQRGRRVLLVGGTPLYLKALLHGLFEGPAGDEAIRQRLEQEAETAGPQALHARLQQVDPIAASRIHANDVRRVVRALEVWEITGRPISAWQQQWHTASELSAWTERCLWLDRPRQELYARIDARVHDMIACGLVEEIRALRGLPRAPSREASQAVGYKEVCAHLDGQANLAQTITLIQTRSRQFAKRQLTWFRQLAECRPVSEQEILTLWNASGETIENKQTILN